MRRAALIYNPNAGRGRHASLLAPLISILRGGGIAAVPHPTAAHGHASELAREAVAGHDLVLAFGGDGTVREAAAGLLGTRTPLGILPGGTTNVLARAFGLPLDPLMAAAQVAQLPLRAIDVGLAGVEPFLMMVSAGIDAAILARVDAGLKRRFGQAAIAAQALCDWWSFDYPELTLESGDQRLTGSFVAVANIPLYGGRYLLAPSAVPDDGRLDAVVLERSGRRATLAFALDLALARHQERDGVALLQIRAGILRGPADTLYQIDGDVAAGRLPVAIGLAPHQLLIFAPRAAGTQPASAQGIDP